MSTGHRRPPLGRGRLGSGRGLRPPPLHRDLLVDLVPRPLQEDRSHHERRLDPFGHPGPLRHRRRARDRRRVPDVPERRLLRRRRARRRSTAAATTSSALFDQVAGGDTDRLERGDVHSLAQRRAHPGRRPHDPWRVPQPVSLEHADATWCVPSTRGSPTTRDGFSMPSRSSATRSSSRWRS